MNTPADRDDEFESAVRARRRLVPRFDDADDAEPPPELDRAVLARARDAARAGLAPAARERERHYRGPRWAVPLALVATVLLSFTLLLQLDPARNAAVLAPREAMPAAATPEAASETVATLPDMAAAAAPPAPSPPAPTATEPTASSPAPRLPTTPGSGAARTAPRPAAALSRAAEAADEAMTTTLGDAARSPPALEAAEPPAAYRGDAQRWLGHIEQLRRSGEIDVARAELDAFRRRYPQVPLPEALQDLLP